MLNLDGLKRVVRRVAAAVGDQQPIAKESLQNPPPRLADLARDLRDADACSAPLFSALQADIAERRRRTDTAAGPASPKVSSLVVCRTGLPDWWGAGDNLLLAAPDAKLPELRLHLNRPPPRRAVVVVGARAVFNHINLGGDGAMVVIGDGVNGAVAALSCLDDSTVLIGQGTSATNWALLDTRNGGLIVTGEDGMWAHGVSLLTDDAFAIRDVATGQRLNVRGGCIVIDRHVWLGENARVLEGARIGHDCVVGASAMVKNAEIPGHSVCVGIPARVVRSGVTWSREDAP